MMLQDCIEFIYGFAHYSYKAVKTPADAIASPANITPHPILGLRAPFSSCVVPIAVPLPEVASLQSAQQVVDRLL
jgi:hypothetical protein